MKPNISIIIPVYNVEAYLADCLDSILAQTFESFEVILVDDGSTDGSPAIAQKYADAHSEQIRYYRKELRYIQSKGRLFDVRRFG